MRSSQLGPRCRHNAIQIRTQAWRGMGAPRLLNMLYPTALLAPNSLQAYNSRIGMSMMLINYFIMDTPNSSCVRVPQGAHVKTG